MNRILIVEDDKIIRLGLTQALQNDGYEVLIAMNGEEGINQAKTEHPHLIVLDIMMPKMNGFEVITELRRHGHDTPIIVLSARVDSQDKVRGLDLGADDYIEKPFNLDELLARIRKQLKKSDLKEDFFGDFKFDWQKRILTDTESSKVISLSTKELKLLELFLKKKEQVLTREIILSSVWSHDYDGTDRTVDNVIMSLRKKLKNLHLITERGLGYRFMTKP